MSIHHISTNKLESTILSDGFTTTVSNSIIDNYIVADDDGDLHDFKYIQADALIGIGTADSDTDSAKSYVYYIALNDDVCAVLERIIEQYHNKS